MSLRCFHKAFDKLNDLTKLTKSRLYEHITSGKGHRFDSINHNWLLLNQFLCLPFCYMSFVIKDKIEQKDEDMADQVFDITPYNYLFNKSTAFIDSSFVREDHEYMENLFSHLNKLNPEYTCQLQYSR